MTNKSEEIIKKLVEKSQEAFIMAIEIYNKPTLTYRVEGFSFFICNAWELLLKAYMLANKESIYYRNDPSRTLSLKDCIKKVLTNKHDPLRQNLEKIVDLRNVSTHYITEEYELIYIPLFQSCVINYTNKLLSYFDIDITDNLSSNFLTLSVRLSDIDEADIQARYPSEIADKLLHTRDIIDNSIPLEGNDKYAIKVVHDWALVKGSKHATATFSITTNADDSVYIMKQTSDPQNSHPFRAKGCIEMVNTWIKQNEIPFVSPNKELTPAIFNQHHFQLFLKFYNIKNDPKYCYIYNISSQPQYSFSQRVVDLIKSKIAENPTGVIEQLKREVKK